MDCAVDIALVQRLIASQFPQWSELRLTPVPAQGWDNRSFRLGDCMIVRIPSAAPYAAQVEKEHRWLPKLGPVLPLEIPQPLALGEPGENLPWRWSVCRWIDGEAAAREYIHDPHRFAAALARFLRALQGANTDGGPVPGPENFFRGGALAVYMQEAMQAIDKLRNHIDALAAIATMESAVTSSWQSAPVWVHGDMSAGNLLVRHGELKAVIDFGLLATGDPACDLAIAWTFLDRDSRAVFKAEMDIGSDTWSRGRAWALWKSAIVAAGLTTSNDIETARCWRTLDAVLSDRD